MNWIDELKKIPLDKRSVITENTDTRRRCLDLLNHWVTFFTEIEKLGFKVKITKKDHPVFPAWVGKANKVGISFRINFESPNVNIFIVNFRGGYEYNGNIDIQRKDLVDALTTYMSIKPPKIEKRKPVTLETLPKPFKFKPTINYKKVVYFIAAIQEVNVVSMVTIESDGKISDKHLSNPNENIWYHLNCVGLQGATFDLISDGEVFYPIVRYGNKRVTTVLTPKASVNLEHASELDKQMIQLAIKKYMEKII